MRTHRRADEGYTLIELMVVLVIVAVLMSFAIPTLLGSREGAEDLAAQAALRDVLLAEKAYYLTNETFTDDATAIRTVEPNALLHPTDATAGVVVVFPTAVTNTVCLTRASDSGSVFAIWESTVGGTYFGEGGLWICPTTPPAGFSGSGW